MLLDPATEDAQSFSGDPVLLFWLKMNRQILRSTLSTAMVATALFLSLLHLQAQAPAPTSAVPTFATTFDRPLYYARAIVPADLENRTLWELTLLRNTIYARAGNTFRKKWLADYFNAQPWYHPLPAIDESKLTSLDRQNAETIAKYDASLSRDQLKAMLQDVMAPLRSGSVAPEDKIELRLLSARLGKWVGPSDTPLEERSPLEDPSVLDKQVSVDQLKDLSRRDLRLLRNTIYARRGRPFRSDLLRAYFEATEWYKADPAYTEARLTAVDNRNIKVIRSVEDQLGGPLTDREHQTEDGWIQLS
jgi:YARHG domain-containing protein